VGSVLISRANLEESKMTKIQNSSRVSSLSSVGYDGLEAGNAVVIARVSSTAFATLTYDAYTVSFDGPQRSFTEPTAQYPVSHSTWVRTLPAPFDGTIDPEWLAAAHDANEAEVHDILAIAMEYIRGAVPIYEEELQIAGDARYGPLVRGQRQEGSDFNDYLGIGWIYKDGSGDKPEKAQFRCLDCSGYMRMIWGYRRNMAAEKHGGIVPICSTSLPDRSAIPRRANEIYESGPGIIVIGRGNTRIDDLSPLRIGDLVFFDADERDGDRLDHVGMFLGVDEGGRYRFISSRKGRNGPTLGDFRGRSVLDGNGLYARSFRAARRV